MLANQDQEHISLCVCLVCWITNQDQEHISLCVCLVCWITNTCSSSIMLERANAVQQFFSSTWRKCQLTKNDSSASVVKIHANKAMRRAKHNSSLEHGEIVCRSRNHLRARPKAAETFPHVESLERLPGRPVAACRVKGVVLDQYARRHAAKHVKFVFHFNAVVKIDEFFDNNAGNDRLVLALDVAVVTPAQPESRSFDKQLGRVPLPLVRARHNHTVAHNYVHVGSVNGFECKAVGKRKREDVVDVVLSNNQQSGWRFHPRSQSRNMHFDCRLIDQRCKRLHHVVLAVPADPRGKGKRRRYARLPLHTNVVKRIRLFVETCCSCFGVVVVVVSADWDWGWADKNKSCHQDQLKTTAHYRLLL